MKMVYKSEGIGQINGKSNNMFYVKRRCGKGLYRMGKRNCVRLSTGFINFYSEERVPFCKTDGFGFWLSNGGNCRQPSTERGKG